VVLYMQRAVMAAGRCACDVSGSSMVLAQVLWHTMCAIMMGYSEAKYNVATGAL
jgi:hypothetical protein